MSRPFFTPPLGKRSFSPEGEFWATLSMQAYLSQRATLFNLESRFSCPDSCERPGCKETDLHISVSLVDLIALSLSSGKRVSDLFRDDCQIGFDPLSEEDPWVGRLTIELKKPCPFLRKKDCAHYSGRPLACALFPEAFFVLHGPDWLHGKEFFKAFPCVTRPCAIPPKRREILLRLTEMSFKESFLSDFFLFGISPLLLDLKNLAGEILEGLPQSPEGKVRLPYHRIGEILSTRLAEGGYREAWLERMSLLEQPQGLEAMEAMRRQTEPLAQPNAVGATTIAYQFEGKRLRPVRRFG